MLFFVIAQQAGYCCFLSAADVCSWLVLLFVVVVYAQVSPSSCFDMLVIGLLLGLVALFVDGGVLKHNQLW